MRLEGDTAPFSAPGQFVNILIPGKFLRRPISVCDYDDSTLTLLYDVVGEGTAYMSALTPGDTLEMLTALGNGFNPDAPCEAPVLLGGGIGTAPLIRLAKDLLAKGKRPTVILGYNDLRDARAAACFGNLECPVFVATVDGSVGTKGFVTDVIRERGLTPDYFYACGPTPMLKALCNGLDIPGEVSLEARMGCGFGACVCCSVMTAKGSKRICKEGPVFRKEELTWK